MSLPENKESIGTFENLELLASELQEKSKYTLAIRIRKLGEEAKNNSKSAREILRNGLSDIEKTEIAGTFPDKGLESDLGLSAKSSTEDLATKAGKDAITSVVGADNAEKIDKGLSFFDKMGTGFDKIGEIFEQKGVIAGIGALFIMIKGVFSGDFSKLDEILGINKPEIKKPEVSASTVESLKDTEYDLGLQGLYALNGGKQKAKEANNSLMNPKIKTKKYSELKKEFEKGKDGISSRLGITDHKDDEVYNGIKILIDSEKIIAKLAKNDTWQETTLEGIVGMLNTRGINGLKSLKDKVGDIEIDITSPYTTFFNITKKLSSAINIRVINGEIDFGELSFNRHIISDFDKLTNIKIFTSGNNSMMKYGEENQGLESSFDITIEKEKELLSKINKYKLDIMNTMIAIFPEENKEDLKNHFKNTGISFKDIVELYIITGGKSDLNILSPVESTLFYTKMFGILGENKDGLRGVYDKLIYDAATGKAENIKIPEEVKNFFNSLSDKIVNETESKLKGLAKEIWIATGYETKIKALLAMSAVAAVLYATKGARIAVGTAATTMAFSYLFNILWNDLGARKIFEREKITDSKSFQTIVEAKKE